MLCPYVKPCPETPDGNSIEGCSGHVWVQELPTGGELRFRVASSGLVTFATPENSFESAESVPVPYRRAARSISEQLDRKALQAATTDTGSVTFCGIATWNEGVEYPWESVPPFVGVDVWSGNKEAFLPPDAATGVFDRLNLETLPAIEKELQTAHADLTQFGNTDEFPQSAWLDGPAAGVLIRDKTGERAQVWHREPDESQPGTEQQSAPDLAETYATTGRIERTTANLRDGATSPTVDRIRDRLVADVAREAYADLYPDGEFIASVSAFESVVAERVQQHQSRSDY